MDDVFALAAPPVAEPARLDVPAEHIAVDTRGPDPLDCGFSLTGGVLAPLPAKVRLPHEDDPEL